MATKTSDVAELAVLKDNMRDVQKNIGEIKDDVKEVSKEIRDFILIVKTDYQTRHEAGVAIRNVEQALYLKLAEVKDVATRRLWQASILSLVVGSLVTIFGQLIYSRIIGN